MAAHSIDELIHAKLKDSLDDYYELERVINGIPDKLNDSLAALKQAIKELPPALNESINLLADAVEEAENSYTSMAEQHRAILNNQLDETRLELRRSMEGAVNEVLREAREETARLTKDIQAARRGGPGPGARFAILFGAVALVSVALISVTLNAYLLLSS